MTPPVNTMQEGAMHEGPMHEGALHGDQNQEFVDGPAMQPSRGRPATRSAAASIFGSASPPLVSLCVSAHNYGRFLPACLESILDQSNPNIECIVVDDGSTDDTGEVLDRYADRITIVRHAVAQGQLNTMVAGFRASQGQFVSFVDADDILYRDFVLTHVTVLISPKTLAAVACSLQHNVDAAGRVLGIHPNGTHWPQQRLPRGTFRRGRVASAELGNIPIATYAPQCNFAHQWLWGTTSSMMFSSQVVALICDPPPDGGRVFADAYIVQFSHAIGGTVVIETPLSAYRRHGGNMYVNNLLIGGLAPLSTRALTEQDEKPLIARQLETNMHKFRRALGLRRFVVTLEKFCALKIMLRAISDKSMEVGMKSLALFLLMRASRRTRIGVNRVALLWAIARLREFS
jgi:glycosyltransferase involved in cell wall biosynthesis